RPAVGQYRAGAADALIASAFGAGQVQVVAHDGQQRLEQARPRLHCGAVDGDGDSGLFAHAATFAAAEASCSTRRSMRGIRSLRYSAEPRTSSTGLANSTRSSPARPTALADRSADKIRSASGDASGIGPQPPMATRTSPSCASDNATDAIAK